MPSTDRFLRIMALCIVLAVTLLVTVLIWIKLLNEIREKREGSPNQPAMEELESGCSAMGNAPVAVSIQTGISTNNPLIVWW